MSRDYVIQRMRVNTILAGCLETLGRRSIRAKQTHVHTRGVATQDQFQAHQRVIVSEIHHQPFNQDSTHETPVIIKIGSYLKPAN